MVFQGSTVSTRNNSLLIIFALSLGRLVGIRFSVQVPFLGGSPLSCFESLLWMDQHDVTSIPTRDYYYLSTSKRCKVITIVRRSTGSSCTTTWHIILINQ